MIYPKAPVDYTEGPSNPYSVSSVAIIKNNYLNLLKINQPSWNNANYTFNYFKINYDTFISTASKFYNCVVINNDNSLNDLTKINPIATRFISSSGQLVIERPPFKTKIRFTPTKAAYASSSRSLPEVEVWIPWQVYILNFNIETQKYHLRIFFNSKPLYSLDDPIVPAWTPNLFGDSGVCYGEDTRRINEEISNIDISNKNIFEILCSSYWGGGWNTDIIPSSYLIPRFLMRDFEIQNDNDFSIYREAIAKSEYAKNKNALTRGYVNTLNIWSNYSLDNLLHMMSNYPTTQTTSLNSLLGNQDERQPYIGNISIRPSSFLADMFARSHKLPFSVFREIDSSKYLHVDFEENPTDKSFVSFNENISQERAYSILIDLIDHYQECLSSNQLNVINNTFFSEEEPF